MEENKTEPLAKTRTRRSNAGARMHEMMFAAEEDEVLAQTLYGNLLKNEDDSSDDEEYVPKDLDNGNQEGAEDLDGEIQSASDSGSGSSSSEDDEDEEDEDEEDDDVDEEEQEEDNQLDERGNKEFHDAVEEIACEKKSGAKLFNSVKQENSRRAAVSFNKHTTNLIAQPGSPTKKAYDSCKKICSVCLGEQLDEDDEIIECDSCGVSVHESCYGVNGEQADHSHEPKANEKNEDNTSVQSNLSSDSTEPWFCEPCKRSVKNPYCELCPNTGGIFKQTDTGRWVHMVCALYTRGVTFENIDDLTEVSLFELNYQLYGSKACTICEDRRLARSGICIGCDAGLCKTFFHVTCAQKEGLLFESHSDEVDPYFAQCKQHADKTVIKKKKRLFTALNARLRRVQPLENCSERIKKKISELTQQPDPHLARWKLDNRPPIPAKVSRSLMTSPSLIIRLTRKSELMGLDPKSAFMSVQDEMEMARQKWHIPPAFDLEFVAYCIDRTTRMNSMKKQNVDLINQNLTLKNEEANLRDKFNSIKDIVGKLKSDCDALIMEARAIQKTVSATTGKPYNLPLQMEQLIARCNNSKGKSPVKATKTNYKTSSTYGCGKCGTIKDQHLLALCDTCHSYFHIYCLDPPLTRVPKKTKFGGWQCSDCSERDEEEQEEAIEEQNALAVQEADGPRKLRERIKFPEKYCHESMMMADFWSLHKKKKKSSKSSKKSCSKKPKLEP